jgi:hypothetical protein
MNTRIFLLALCLFTFTVDSFTQEISECGVTIPAGITPEQVQSNDLSLFESTTTYNLRLAIHIVRYNNGSDGITEVNLVQKKDALNDFMQQADLQFYEYTRDTIDSDYFANLNENKIDELFSLYYIDGCINIYFVPVFSHKGWSSFSSRFGITPQGIVILNTAPETTLPHEMGHYFDLLHTHELWYFEEIPGIPITIFENIARDGGCANCDNAGDLLCDTPADPSMRMRGVLVDPNCIWNPNSTPPPDECDSIDYNPLTNNLMTTELHHSCRTTFTSEQKLRMKETLLQYRSDLLKHLIYLENSVNSLNAGGTLRIHNQNYESGTSAFVETGEHNIGTNNERFTSDNIYKHNYWNQNGQDFYLSRNINIENNGEQLAKFSKLHLAAIRNSIDGMSFNDGVPIWFNDPWYVKDEYSTQSGMGDFLPFPSPYYPTGKYSETTGGVFLNQGLNEFGQWVPPYYSVKAESVLDTSLTNTGNPAGRSHRFYFRNWSADSINGQPSAQFQYPNSLTTPVVFKSENATVQANLKGTQLSNNLNAFTSNSQRKSVRTPNGHLVNIYESLGMVWLENSTDNGQSWFILNNANPFVAEPSVNPAIDYFPWSGTHSSLAAVYYPHGILKMKVMKTSGTIDYNAFLPWDPGEGYPVVPSVAVSSDRILVVSTGGINGQNGLVYFYGTVQQSPFNITWTQYNLILPGTGQYSSNPTITAIKTSDNVFHIAWQEGSSIKYCKATDSDNNLTFEPVETPSTLSGYQKHLNPSISLVNGYPILSWTGVQYAGLEKVLIKDNDGTTGYQRALIRRKGPQGWGDT